MLYIVYSLSSLCKIFNKYLALIYPFKFFVYSYNRKYNSLPYALPLFLPCRLYEDLFTGERRNPNGCPIAATFFVSHEWTDYGQVSPTTLYLQYIDPRPGPPVRLAWLEADRNTLGGGKTGCLK